MKEEYLIFPTMKNNQVIDNEKFEHLYKTDCKTGGQRGECGRIYRSWSGGRCRIVGGENADYCYHVMSRTCGGEYLFESEEKEAFRKIMRLMARFCGVKILTYAVMSNHFHILARVPCRAKFLNRFDDKPGEESGAGEERLLKHLSILYSQAYTDQVRRELAWMRARQMDCDAEKFLLKYKRRFCDISLFTKEVKERFSRWFNKKHARRGTLWMDRFKSILVENGDALRTISAYIDLNPVRAGLVDNPKNYRWCGYADAMSGSKQARRGLCRVMEKPLDSWEDNCDWYRCWLTLDCDSEDTLKKDKISARDQNQASQTKAVTQPHAGEKPKQQPRYQQLRSRIRYFTDGSVLGSPSFINLWFAKNREKFSPRRLTGVSAKKIPITPKSPPERIPAPLHAPKIQLYTLKGKIK